VPPQVFELRGEERWIVSRDAEIRNGEPMHEQRRDASQSQGRQQSQTSFARDSGKNQILYDLQVPVGQVLSCGSAIAQDSKLHNHIGQGKSGVGYVKLLVIRLSAQPCQVKTWMK
jgi:hypothetical protein